MSSTGEIELLRNEARYHRDRVALLSAKQYRWAWGQRVALRELERELARAQQRLRDARSGEAR